MGLFDFFKKTVEWDGYESLTKLKNNFQNKNLRIQILESFFKSHELKLKELKSKEISTFDNEYIEEFRRYNYTYKEIMKIYFRWNIQMINDVRNTRHYKNLDDKRDFEESHREYGNEILGMD
jgi:hypothetical protein